MASDGQEALDWLRDSEADLIITDIRMPKINGVELMETIRNERLSNAYIFILSGYNDFKYMQAAIHYSAMEYILKPVQKEQLIESVRRVAAKTENRIQEEIDSRRMHRGYLMQNMMALLRGIFV